MQAFRIAGIAALGCVALPTAAIAQTTGVAEIVVTAQKRVENLQDVPLAVTAFSSEAMEQRGITGLASLVQTPPPGITMQPFGGQQTLLIVDIRGVTNGDPGQGTIELGTAVYIDDVYMGRAQGLGVELVDPERIEVLRGPQGTLFGRNAEGGAIRIVTKKPTGEFGGNGKVTFGNYGERRYQAHLNLPEFAGFSVKLDYLNSRHDGYTKNLRDPRLGRQLDYGELDAEGYRGSVRWQPTYGITVDYAYDYSKALESPDYNVLLRPPSEGCISACAPLATHNGARRLTDHLDQRTDETWLPLYQEGFRTKAKGHTLQAEIELSDSLTLRSITSFRSNDYDGSNNLGGALVLARLGPAGLPISALFPRDGQSLGLAASTRAYGLSGVMSYVELEQKQRSQEFQLIGSTDTLEYVLGAYYFHEKVSDFRQAFQSIIYTDPALTTAVPTNPFSPGSPTANTTAQSTKSRSYAAFAQATWTPEFAADRLHLTAGIRYTDDSKTFLRTLPANLVGKPFKEKRFDPAFTIAYDIADNVNAFARYAQAYRAGGVSVRSPSFRPFGAEVNKAIEFGLKSDLLDRRLRLNLAAFQNRILNRQITAQLDPTNAPGVTDVLNGPGVTRIRGIEMEMIAAPTDGLQFSVNYSYLHGKRPESYRVIEPTAELRLQSLPKHALTVAVDYALPPADYGQWVLHFDYSVASKTPGTGRVDDTAFAWDIERNVANGRIGLNDIPVGPTTIKVAGFVRNLFDTAYPVFTAPGANAILSPPRTYGVEIGASF